MDKQKKELLEEARRLELNMAKLYIFYSENFKEDSEFWRQIAKEETEHAALLKVVEDFSDKFPEGIIYTNLDELKNTNKYILDAIEKYRKKSPTKQKAYKQAIELEESAYELHYQKLASIKLDSEVLKRFQKLNADDKDHAERIKKLLSKYDSTV